MLRSSSDRGSAVRRVWASASPRQSVSTSFCAIAKRRCWPSRRKIVPASAPLRRRGERRGFRAVNFDGDSWDLARVNRPGPPRVGRYGVDLDVMETLATRLAPSRAVDVWLVDEIGKMECLSPTFVTAMRRLLDGQ